MAELYQYMVGVRCFTFNQSKYILDTLNGFCAQRTNFPYVCLIVDDCSTDGEQTLLERFLNEKFDTTGQTFQREETEDYSLEYAQHKENRNCFFAVYFLKYNHHRKKSKSPYYAKYVEQSKYIATCEGDDFWIDEDNLQTKVDFLEKHPDFSMVFSNVRILANKEFLYDSQPGLKDREVSLGEIILNGGMFVPTPSRIYRRQPKGNAYPDFCKKCWVGDYPLQIYLATKGRVFCFSRPMAIYRYGSEGSWSQRTRKVSFEKKRAGIESELIMLNGMNSLTEYKYNAFFLKRKIRMLKGDFFKESKLGLSGRWYNIFFFPFLFPTYGVMIPLFRRFERVIFGKNRKFFY